MEKGKVLKMCVFIKLFCTIRNESYFLPNVSEEESVMAADMRDRCDKR